MSDLERFVWLCALLALIGGLAVLLTTLGGNPT